MNKLTSDDRLALETQLAEIRAQLKALEATLHFKIDDWEKLHQEAIHLERRIAEDDLAEH